MTTKVLLRLIAVALAIDSVSLTLAACGQNTGPAQKPIVVLSSATANESAPVLAAADKALLYTAGADSSDATAYVVNPNTGQPAVVTLTPRRSDGQIEWAQPRRGQLLAANVNQVQEALNREAATGPFDLLSDISAAARAVSGPAELLVLSSGLSAAGAFNLVDVGWGASPAAVASQLKSSGMLPSLRGWHVIFSGLGDVSGDQSALPLPERTTLTSYWLAICRATGAVSCATDHMTRPEPPSRSTTPVPVIPIPSITSVRGPHGWTGENVPADEFFAFDSTQLLPGADSILGPLATKANSGHLLVSITGYASPDGGSDAYNVALSKARAIAVEGRLIALGVNPVQIVQVAGLGTGGKARSACYHDGQIEESICAQLRRVIILLGPKGETQ
ncbi:MAG: OmpA family protein [Trebonia sp.]